MLTTDQRVVAKQEIQEVESANRIFIKLATYCYTTSASFNTTLQNPRTSPIPNPRRPLVSVSSRSRRIRKLLPQLCVCVSRLVTMVCIWCTRSLGRLNFLDLLLRHNALVGGHPGPRKKADEHSSTR